MNLPHDILVERLTERRDPHAPLGIAALRAMGMTLPKSRTDLEQYITYS